MPDKHICAYTRPQRRDAYLSRLSGGPVSSRLSCEPFLRCYKRLATNNGRMVEVAAHHSDASRSCYVDNSTFRHHGTWSTGDVVT